MKYSHGIVPAIKILKLVVTPLVVVQQYLANIHYLIHMYASFYWSLLFRGFLATTFFPNSSKKN
jgi:hypothetical protein